MSFNPGKSKYGKTKLVFTDILLEYLNFCFIILVYACVSEYFKFIDGKVCQTLLIDCPFA